MKSTNLSREEMDDSVALPVHGVQDLEGGAGVLQQVVDDLGQVAGHLNTFFIHFKW